MVKGSGRNVLSKPLSRGPSMVPGGKDSPREGSCGRRWPPTQLWEVASGTRLPQESVAGSAGLGFVLPYTSFCDPSAWNHGASPEEWERPSPLSSLLEPQSTNCFDSFGCSCVKVTSRFLVCFGSVCMLNFLIVTRRATFLGVAERLLEEWSVFPEQLVLRGNRMRWKWQLAGNHKEERNP